MSAKYFPGLFKNRYPELKGKLWILQVSREDLLAFAQIGRQASEYGKQGGKARAKTAKRDAKGKFMRSE